MRYALAQPSGLLPLFYNGISRKVGPAPSLSVDTRKIANTTLKRRWFLTVTGRVESVESPNHATWMAMAAARGWVRIVPHWVDIQDSNKWKLWMLGRLEFSPKSCFGRRCTDPFVIARTNVLRKQTIFTNYALGYEGTDGLVREVPLSKLDSFGGKAINAKAQIACPTDLNWRSRAIK